MKKFLSFLISRQFLALLALLTVALAIWFSGPFIAFGSLKPFAGAGARVLMTALLLAGVLLRLAGLSISPVVITLLCLLIWHAGPLLAFGDIQPFASVETRSVAIAIVLLVFAGYWLFRLWQEMRTNRQFLDRVLSFGAKKEPSPAAERLKEVAPIVSGALARLKAMRTGARGPWRLFQGKRYLYELPWYIALGSRSSGKTSMLLNAGLSFPLAEQMQRAVRATDSHTQNMDWWLTNDAVLIDTAGYYTRHGTSEHGVPAPFDTRAKRATDNQDGQTNDNKVDDKAISAAAAKLTAATTAAMPSTETGKVRARADAAEWLGVLGMLRKYRPRAPINGVLLTVDLAVLASRDGSRRLAEAADLRARLAELRRELGIHFPVYLVITKADRLTGFVDYFAPLTAEGRCQAWGFTLPHGEERIAKEDIRARCLDEHGRLVKRLVDGINTRLQDEHDTQRRRKLAVLPQEFAALAGPLSELITLVFLDSRYDDTPLYTALRGVYFTSAVQTGDELVVDRHTIAQRLTPATANATVGATRETVNESFFLRDLLAKIVLPEAHLVRPNLRWEFRFRFLRLLGHALAVLIFVWLMFGLRVSFGHNTDYLVAVAQKAQALSERVKPLYQDPKPPAIADTLSDARHLPTYPGLDLSDPDGAFGYGLYTAKGVATESRRTYDALQDHLLLPHIVRRMGDVISQSVASKDATGTYDALRVYLMLYDKVKFNADDVRTWVLDDWANADGASIFGGRASMIDHVQHLFSGDRVVQSPLIRNSALIQQARGFLDESNSTDRMYQRAKTAMSQDAPDDFTLMRAVGPHAGTVFTRESGAPLSRGVPGLFTLDGYRNLFDKRLPEFVRIARDDDTWVMGRSYPDGPSAPGQKKTTVIAETAAHADNSLTEAIRREYLIEYARQWDAFLGDVRTVAGASLAFNLHVLRSFAAPDSPLARLARAAAYETTLTQPAAVANGSLRLAPAEQLARQANTPPGIPASERIERELVDNHFAALREVVTGSADARNSAQFAAPAGTTGLNEVTNLLNDYYTALTIAENAISNNSMPPTSDAAAKLKMTANTMPSPFREVLLQLAQQGSQGVNHGIGQLLSTQMQAAVGDSCRLAIEGSYPFAPDSTREVSIDDFTRLFAQGGLIDDFFTKTLAPFVDTSAKPWRYRTLPGATDPVQGPDLQPFQRAKAIRDVFFGGPGHKQLMWKAHIQIPELDPTITELLIDIDGQSTRYQHGPVTPFTVTWPGPRGGVHAEITANPRIRPDSSTLASDGPWALMRLLRKGNVVETAIPGRTRVVFDFDERRAVLDVFGTGSVANPLTSDVLSAFGCPSSMPTFHLTDTGPPPGLPPAGRPMHAASRALP
ncbi:type VI secretion system membrane subunit TssM [Burkholderia ubonensis]|uniref:Type VI secretion protein VasK n=1 Tax=Burkholderia ubonensis TaxID=101571 RepID=A0A1R1JIM5_9BURK|nr:type VI secretion system membrane subunit TssM [Burkholderia ubonensis]OMG75196.1 type VI secretion protein VasK [Burkholderia ubonensis]